MSCNKVLSRLNGSLVGCNNWVGLPFCSKINYVLGKLLGVTWCVLKFRSTESLDQ